MGGKYLNSRLKAFATESFPDSKTDLFAVFAERLLQLLKPLGHIGLMTPFVWMFLSSYESLRRKILYQKCLMSLIQPEYHAFFDSAYVPICSFIVWNVDLDYHGIFINLTKFYG